MTPTRATAWSVAGVLVCTAGLALAQDQPATAPPTPATTEQPGPQPESQTQPETRRLDVTVTSVSGSSVYIDSGRSAGIAIGSRIVFILSTGERIETTIAAVTSNSARAELPEGATPPAINDHAEVLVDVVPESAPTDTTKPAAPEHPPWQRQEGPRTADTPLLAPAFSTPPKDRPTTIRGRFFTIARITNDLENDQNYTYFRAGAFVEINNPLKDGGRLLFEGDADLRSRGSIGDDGTDLNARLQRLSYAWGTDQHAPYRAEVGRYYSTSLPELGLIDGGEAAIRFQNGLSVGAGAGLYPIAVKDSLSTDDYGLHLFADYVTDAPNGYVQGTVGFQQTWHKGELDRSLLILRGGARPLADLNIFASALIDFYTGEDTIKSGLDLTQFVTQASYTINPKTGATASFTHTSWPELKREEYALLPTDLIDNGHVERLSASIWRKVTKEFRVTARANYWMDQDRDGNGAELSADWAPQGANNTSLYGAVYYDSSSFTTGVGARLQARRDVGSVRVFAGYEVFSYSTDTLTGGSSDYLRHTLRADVNWSRGKWYFDVDAAYNFGDQEQSIELGAYVQYRF
ncbi:MAG: hypothetical protein IPK69_06590 [Phycisphaerales bacterium]|nr:MAG: hypothetical protein IPK69_06590 [Phycisphaerales bacterium]